MSERKTYKVDIYRDGEWYMAFVPALEMVTNGRNFDDAAVMARDLIAVTLDVPRDSFDIAAEGSE